MTVNKSYNHRGMETQILAPTPQGFAAAAEFLHHHQPVAFPTETVYGLGARVFDEEGLRRIYSIKGRPSDNPLIVHIASLDQVELLAQNIPESFKRLTDAFFPGPLTIVLPRRSTVPGIISGGLPTVALRMPSHPIALQLIKVVGEPLAAPSANLSGRPSPTQAWHVMDDLQGRVAAIIDGGPTTHGIESTVIDLTGETPTLLRPGSITALQLAEVLGTAVDLSDDDKAAHSPGMRYRHYAPSIAVVIYDSAVEFNKRYDSTRPAEYYILSNHPLVSAPHSKTKPLNPQTLFAEFRAAEKYGATEIAIILDPSTRADAGLMNRIMKAAAGT